MIFLDTEDDKGIKLVLSFDGKKAEYTVTVSKDNIKKVESWSAHWGTPTFGPDVADQNEAMIRADRLAEEIEKELGI